MANPRPDEKQSEPRQETRQEKSGAQAAARENIRSVSDMGSRIAGSAADLNQRAAQTGLEMIDKNKEAAQQFWDASTELFAYCARRSTDQVGRIFGVSGDNAENVARNTSKNFDALLQSSDAITSASHELFQEWFDTMRRMIDATVGRTESLVGCRTPNELFAMQIEIMRDSAEAALHGTKRMSEISANVASQATQKISETARRAA